MKKLILIPIILILNGCASTMNIDNKNQEIKQQSVKDIWQVVSSSKYDKLPQTKVSFWKLFTYKKDKISIDAYRTLNSYDDILEPFEKLAHPNGICLKGVWDIDTQNSYSGYFKQGTQALIIARISSAMSNTKKGEQRSFGFAGKIFPTLDENKINKQHSANFFLMDDVGGTNAEYFKDTVLTNEPSVSFTFEVLKNIMYGIKVATTFDKADSNSGIRQLYEVSELDESGNISTPKWMKIEIQNWNKTNTDDFRDELTIENDEELVFDIFVSSKENNNKKEWLKIGTMKFDTSVTSTPCDKQLHFHHPKWKNES